jgi:acetyl-CoA synthase
MCGAYNWLDGKASFEINPTGPNQPIVKGDLIDADLGQWKGINDFVNKASRGKVERVSAYSLMVDPMTACGCFECIATMLPICNGIMIVNRDYLGMTPAGMKFTTLAGMVGGGQVTPGFLGVSKHYICSRKFMKAEGGLKRVVWMPKILKDEIRDRLQKRAEEENAPDLVEMIADDEVGITEDEVLRYIKEKEHPALSMEKVM